MKPNRVTIAIIASFIIHLGIIAGLVWLDWFNQDKATGQEEYIISVDMISSQAPQPISQPKENVEKVIETKPDQMQRETKKVLKQKIAKQQSQRRDQITQKATIPQVTGSGGMNQILAVIKTKIERNKYYPKTARKMGLTGRPTVMFEIDSSGKIKYVKIVSSSGESIIDKAAIETVKRASPLPFYPNPIKLAIKYELK